MWGGRISSLLFLFFFLMDGNKRKWMVEGGGWRVKGGGVEGGGLVLAQ